MKVGDYVRTKKGISKIKDFLGKKDNINFYQVDKNGTHQPLDCFIDIVFENEIIKSSPNVIDLIEVGDYVNGEKITEISESGKVIFYWDYDRFRSIENNSIKLIVTHEQFLQMEYKVGE